MIIDLVSMVIIHRKSMGSSSNFPFDNQFTVLLQAPGIEVPSIHCLENRKWLQMLSLISVNRNFPY